MGRGLQRVLPEAKEVSVGAGSMWAPQNQELDRHEATPPLSLLGAPRAALPHGQGRTRRADSIRAQ